MVLPPMMAGPFSESRPDPDKASHFLAQHCQNYATAITLGRTRYATMSAAGKKNKLKMKYPMKL
jgi:hypothetical protein